MIFFLTYIFFLAYMVLSRWTLIHIINKTHNANHITLAQRNEALLCSITPMIGDLVFFIFALEGIRGLFDEPGEA